MEVARHVYGGRPTEQELAAFGAELEDVTGDVEVWPENMEAVGMFLKLGTQWRHGPNGLVGLIYAEFWKMLAVLRVPRARWIEIFEAIQVMESAVLELMAERAKRDG